jgi:transcriptional regulator with XRE-family HTH domain
MLGKVWLGKAGQGRRGKVMKAEQLKKLRKKLALSVANAAQQVHVTPRSWARYEAGDRAIPDGVVHLFCIQNKLDVNKYLPRR